jgi:hypothetical protein
LNQPSTSFSSGAITSCCGTTNPLTKALV